jgi:hypothetical protein
MTGHRDGVIEGPGNHAFDRPPAGHLPRSEQSSSLVPDAEACSCTLHALRPPPLRERRSTVESIRAGACFV